MKLNNKGFVASTLMYSLLILFLFLILGLIALLSNRKMILDKLKNDIKDEVNSTKKYTYYENGTPIYFNPVTNKICGNYTEENSLNETKTGCLKWYIFNDDINNASVNMILDHNTTYNVAYNSTGSNSEMKEIKDELDALVNQSKWKVTPRLITADEIAHIVGADSNDTIKWKSNKPNGTNIENQSGWFYLDGSGNTYSDTNGWRKANSHLKSDSNYTWLWDYISYCETRTGCNIQDNNTDGYWTSSPLYNNNTIMWHIYTSGILGTEYANKNNVSGVRPVISVDKKEFKKSFVTTYDYTGDVQTFVTPVSGQYKLEVWGAQGGENDNDGNGGKGGHTSGNIYLLNEKKLYIYVGESGTNANKQISYNGGGSGLAHSFSGGGATDIRLVSGNWDDFNSLKSRIMVAAGGGGTNYWGIDIAGGEAGGLSGENGNARYTNSTTIGATQISGGIGYNTDRNYIGGNGLFGKGGLKNSDPYGYGGGGGSGYYGGAAGGNGNNDTDSGSGGSSFISGHNGCVAITNDSTEDNIIQRNDSKGNKCTNGTTDITCSYHYSGYKFTDTVMIDGAGCKWTTEKTNDCTGMPTHDGKSTMIGNTGNGYAKITYLGN